MRVAIAVLVLAASISGAAGCSTTPYRSPWAMLEQAKVYQPVRYPEGNWRPAGLAYEDAWFAAADGTRLHGWFVPCQQPRAVVLFAHGNSGNIAVLADVLKDFCRRHRVAVMVFDYRGFGRSEGTPSEDGLYQDARAARVWLAHRSGLRETDLVLMGRSLGGGVMVDLAAKDGARGLVLESTFTSIPDVGRHYAPYLPVRWLMVSRFESLEKISSYHGPLLESHGDADSVIPYAQAERLFAAANQPKWFVRIRGGDHNDPQSEEYHRLLDAFLDSLPPVGAVPTVAAATR